MNVSSFSKDELLALFGFARHHRERDWLLLLVAFWHGLRVSEVIAITRDDIRDGYLTVARLKGSKRTTQPLIVHAEPLLNEHAGMIEYARSFNGSERLFKLSRRQADRLIRKYGRLAGLPEHKLHMHTLKHSCAMYLVGKIQLHELQQYLGHEKLSSTGEYLKVTDEQASGAVRDALKL